MDSSGEDGECQVEAVITPQSKKGQQGKLPFQTLSTDSPKVNKKRKSVVSPDCRSAQYAKVDTKENSFQKSEKGKTEDIVVIAEEKKNKNDSTTVKDASKLEEKSDTNSPINKKSSGRGPGKHEKFESKVPVNPLTKFFKKVDSKDSKNEAQSPSSKNDEEKTEKSVETESKDDFVTENVEDEHENEDVTETKKDEEHYSDSEEDVVELHETSSSSKENETVDTSHLNETDNMDVDSDPHSDLDDSHDNDDDSHKSGTDCNKTDSTNSKDDTSRGGSTGHITPTKNKLFDSKGKETKLTPKQLEKKLEIQKKREMRDKQRQEREKKLQDECENRKREKEEKQLEQDESSYGESSNSSKKTGALKKVRQLIFQKDGNKESTMPSPTASTSNLVLNETKSDGCRELVDDAVLIKLDVSGDWQLLHRALKFASDTFIPLIILFKTNFCARKEEFCKYITQDNNKYNVFYSNRGCCSSSEVILLANKHGDVHLQVKYLPDNSDLLHLNYFIAVKVKLDERTKFNLIALDTCTQNLQQGSGLNKKPYRYIQKMIDVPTMIFINCDEQQTPDILKITNKFELKKKIMYLNASNSMMSTFFCMSKTYPVGLENMNITAPSLESPACMVVKRDKESE